MEFPVTTPTPQPRHPPSHGPSRTTAGRAQRTALSQLALQAYPIALHVPNAPLLITWGYPPLQMPTLPMELTPIMWAVYKSFPHCRKILTSSLTTIASSRRRNHFHRSDSLRSFSKRSRILMQQCLVYPVRLNYLSLNMHFNYELHYCWQ